MVKHIPGNNIKTLGRVDKEFSKRRDVFDNDSGIAVGKLKPSNL